MAPRRIKSSTKNPSFFSHEFVIQNHADIVSCMSMVILAGFMFQSTSSLSTKFISLHYNSTVNDSAGHEHLVYSSGSKDLLTVSFYFLISIVIHAVLQEYVLDKLNRKMHLSKTKHSKFSESGQLFIFFFYSAMWGLDIIFRESFVTGVSQLWEGYPNTQLPFIAKLFFIFQISFWLHNFPELYFQKVRKEDMLSRIQYSSMYLVVIAAAHFLNFHRVALCLMVLHYMVEAIYHLALLCHFSERLDTAKRIFTLFDVLFVVARLVTVTVAILTFWYGLAKSSQSQIDIATGNFNTSFVRITCFSALCLIQAGLMWNFITFHIRKMREKYPAAAPKKVKASPNKKKPSKSVVEDLDSLPEVDQNSATDNGNVRSRKTRK